MLALELALALENHYGISHTHCVRFEMTGLILFEAAQRLRNLTNPCMKTKKASQNGKPFIGKNRISGFYTLHQPLLMHNTTLQI
jgi:hypothetical protein